MQKYERGANRIGASRLFDLSRVLDVPVSFFFDDMPEEPSAVVTALDGPLSDDPRPGSGYEPDPMAKRETLELVRAYYRISDPSVRKRLFELTKAVANAAAPWKLPTEACPGLCIRPFPTLEDRAEP